MDDTPHKEFNPTKTEKSVQQVSGKTAKPQITTHTAEDLNKGFYTVRNNIKQPDISSFIESNNNLNTQQNITPEMINEDFHKTRNQLSPRTRRNQQ